MERIYEEIVTELKQRFPEGTVKFREDTGRPYIPNQVYTDRVEQATASQWDREIKDIDINVQNRYVKAIVRIHIQPHYRDGYGFAIIKGDPTKDPHHISNAVDQAVNDAMREALDSYEMGWKDLAPYKQDQKDWASNPALKHLLVSEPPHEAGAGSTMVQPFSKIHHKCIFGNCGEQLTQAEWDLLGKVPNLNRDKMIYCFNHLPSHMKRRLPEDILKSFEAQWEKYSST